jgi:alkanesulfonate monooxygenase SsuD/methylene tetrahydromethanopterin reductase-like flavin-dependent oxidoreductase (luciferase family)
MPDAERRLEDSMRFGALVLPTDPWAEAVATARRLEALGYDHLWVYDHLYWRRYRDRPWHATYPWLAGLAALTERIRLGTMVANPNLRHPLVLAKDAMTIDHISDGRLTIGIGAGGSGFDATILGQRPLTGAERADRFIEYVDLLDRLLRGEAVDVRGEWFTVKEARVLPACVQQPRVPLAVAAGGPRGLEVAARVGDAWITYGDPTTHDRTEDETEAVVRRQVEELERRCEQHGRDPGTVDRIYLIGNTRARPLRSVEAFLDFAGRYEALGFTDLVFHHPRLDDEVWNEDPGVVADIAAALGLVKR